MNFISCVLGMFSFKIVSCKCLIMLIILLRGKCIFSIISCFENLKCSWVKIVMYILKMIGIVFGLCVLRFDRIVLILYYLFV